MTEAVRTVGDLPERPGFDVAMKAMAARKDIPRVCWICQQVLSCGWATIAAADQSWGVGTHPPEKLLTSLCAAFMPGSS